MKKFVLKKLAKWAHELWLREKPVVIAITGSIAKTSTKEAIFSVMEEGFPGKVFCTPGNLNNEFGLPLAILGFEHSARSFQYLWVLMVAYLRRFTRKIRAQYWILEMGADRPGDIKYLTKIVKPDVAVVTAVGASHLELLKSIDGVWDEKADLVRAVDEDGAVFLNGKNDLVRKMAEASRAKVVYFNPLPDQIAQEAAREIGRFFGILDEKIELAIADFKKNKGRMNIFEGKNGALVIDDSYNANPLSMEVALYSLDKLAKDRKKTRRIAVLGDMFDLGTFEKTAHENLHSLIDKYCDYFVGIGPLMKEIKPDEWYENSSCENFEILNNLSSDDIILVKGSRGMEMEKIIDRLKNNG